MPFKEHESKQKEERNVFDDSYKLTPVNQDKVKQKYTNNYVNGNLKTNIIFDDQFVLL